MPLLMVHLSVAVLPAATPVTEDISEEGEVIPAVPLTTDQRPVPDTGLLPVNVKLPLSHWETSGPALASVGSAWLVSTASSTEAPQLPLLIVHRSVALVPASRPVTVDVADEGFVMNAVPLTTDQTPVPMAGVLPAIVKLPLLHLASSGPALEGVGGA